MMALAICGLVWLLDARLGLKEAAACGWFFGLGQFTTGLYWISISFQFQANMPPWLGWVAVVGLAAYLALYPAACLWISARFWPAGPERVLVLACSWTATEWMRGHFLTGFPWNTVAQIWADSPMVMQSARLFGAYGLTLLTVTVFASLTMLAEKGAAARRAIILAALIPVALLGDGWSRLRGIPDGDVALARVHLVQANIRQDLEVDPQRQQEILELYERLTAASIRERGSGLVIWPETAVEYDVEGDATLRRRLGQIIGRENFLILGAVGQRWTPTGAWLGSRNSLIVVDGSGAARGVYDKVRLVPFGEYLPGGRVLSQLGLVSVAGGSSRFLAGAGPATLEVPGVPPFAPLICYEVIFPRQFVDRSARPDWLLNISNDAWFGESSGPHQHLAQARLRAVEEGLPVVRSTPTGISAIIDPYGRVQRRTRLGERAVLTGHVPQPLAATPFARFGDVVLLVLLFAWVFLAWRLAKVSRFEN